ncbi:ribonuclease PH [Candidatus Sumerlaeota bacterium]|nr:ribonuclease PH [Candidatus Sumerlaeota bacterium]
MRVDGRSPDQLRLVKVETNCMDYAEGSALIEIGKTRVLCTATVENTVPPHVKGTGKGWLTAEYAMLPRSSAQRIPRDGVKGKIGGRSHEIQRLIGRALRSVFEMDRFGERTVIMDCDVIQADGGTRTAAITGSFIALGLALGRLREEGKINIQLLRDYLGAVSVGVVEGVPVLDLCYLEDSQAEVDMNLVLTGGGKFVEIQGTAESAPFGEEQLSSMIALGRAGIAQLIEIQRGILDLDFKK